MGIDTAISWTDHTWNPWRGCRKISQGCKNCYMFAGQNRWGKDPSQVVRAADATFKFPLKIKEPSKIFTCSWSDFFIEDADEWRDEVWKIIKSSPHIFQILTKRPENILGRLPDSLGSDLGDGWPWPNVWLGVSIESNEHVGRADILRKIPAAIRFISYEPALGPLPDLDLTGIHWLIYGGESGPGRREDDPAWADQIFEKCRLSGTAFFYKQASAPRPGFVPAGWHGVQKFPINP